MRNLTDRELQTFINKAKLFIGDNISEIINENTSLAMNKKDLILFKKELEKKSSNIPKSKIIFLGTVLGRFRKNRNENKKNENHNKTSRFEFDITALSILSKYAINKVYIKKSAEMNVLYGNNVLKSHLYKIPENLEQKAAVVLYNTYNVPLGFGITSKSSASLTVAGGSSMAIIRQGDAGDYLRRETEL
ncbi:PUA domain containing protein [Spraguea lophii 42_110]|uniref:60S ribosome subunit biogenesis protein NIP7 n=1 Tax=Spraguea lophii (strain 42_110) TaxID=1358809 RepID=S7W9P6_SPRLO|nr:PUA domain containing protein [Spraguea lophii 42_110]